MTDSPSAPSSPDPAAVLRKVRWRILPLMFIIYFVSYLDRANASFAKLQMKPALGFTDDVFGWGFGLFFAGYLLLEVPGALLVEHWSARKWFSRVLVTWGLCSMGMALVRTPGQFYLARVLLGLAEAGFFPGLIVYFTHWFPKAERARALAGMVLAVPFSLALGGPLSGLLLQLHAFGLDGWQWMFLVEGLPAVLLGIALPFVVTDRPRDARWLEPAERHWLMARLEAERTADRAAGGASLGAALREPNVWALALALFTINTGGYAMVFWMPTAVQGLLVETRQASGELATAAWTGPIFLCGMLGVLASGRWTHRYGGGKWQAAVAVGLVGVGFTAIALLPLPWVATFPALCITGFFAFYWIAPYWTLPTATLTASAAAVAVGIINMAGNLAGLVGSPIVGTMKEAGLDDRACLLFFAANYVAGGIILVCLRAPTARQQAPPLAVVVPVGRIAPAPHPFGGPTHANAD